MQKLLSSFARPVQISSAIVILAVAAGCGGGSSPAANASPTAPGSPTSAAVSGATVMGTVTTGLTTSAVRPAAVGLTVSVEGTAIVSAVDGGGNFRLNGVPAGSITLHFSGPGTDARLTLANVEDHATVEIHVTVSGNQASVDDDHRQTPDNRVEIEGRISEVNASAKTVRVGTNTVNVPAGATIRHGGTPLDFTSLKINTLVHIKATISGTTLTAQEIQVQTDEPGDANDDDNPNAPGAQVELKGTIAGRSGSCPSLSFALGSTTVKTNTNTTFKDVACAALKDGDRVEVKGTRQSSTVVLASRVAKED